MMMVVVLKKRRRRRSVPLILTNWKHLSCFVSSLPETNAPHKTGHKYWPKCSKSMNINGCDQNNSKTEAFRHLQLMLMLTKCVCACVWDNTPRSEHHVNEERQQIIHAPQVISIHHRFYLQVQLLKCLLDDQQLIWWSKCSAARMGGKINNKVYWCFVCGNILSNIKFTAFKS